MKGELGNFPRKPHILLVIVIIVYILVTLSLLSAFYLTMVGQRGAIKQFVGGIFNKISMIIPHYPDAEYDIERKIIIGGPETYVPDPRGLGYAFYTHMKRNRKSIAQIDSETGKTEYFGSLLRRSIRAAIELRNRGISPGDVVSICTINSLDNFVPFIATQMIGAIVASLDPTISKPDTEHLIKQVEPKIIFVSPISEPMIESVIKNIGLECEIVVIGESNKHTEFKDFVQEQDEENDFRPYEVEDLFQTAVILFSSGTTGLSKGICIHHYGLFYQAHSFVTTGCVHDLMLSYASTYWISTVLVLCAMQIFGKARLIAPKYNPKEIWHLIDKYKVTCIFLAPVQAIMMLKAGRPEGINTTKLHDILIGGGPLSAENNLAITDLLPGTYVHQIYGQSEAAGIVTCFRPADRKDVMDLHEKPQSCGKPMLGVLYKIVDPETEECLGPNQRGELRYLSKAQMNGYHKRDSSDAFDEDGYIITGDIAYFDEDLCFYIVDRIKEMLKFQAFHVTPAKIEGVLLSHPAVATVAVIGIPHEIDGDHPMALVKLQPGATVTEDELVQFVEDRVDDRSRLRAGVRFINSIPYTPSGKIKKVLLRNMVLNGEI